MPPIGTGALAAAAAALAPNVVFIITFEETDGTLTPAERTALREHYTEAGRRWTAVMDLGTVRSSIELVIEIDNSQPGVTGASETSAFVGVIGGRETWEQGAAAEVKTGVDPNGADSDARVRINLPYLRAEEWFDPDPRARTAPVPPNKTDAMSTALHEFGHIFAYSGWSDGLGVPPPDMWSTFDRWIIPGTGPADPPRFSGPRAAALPGPPLELTIGNSGHLGNPPRHGAAPSPLLDELMNGVAFIRGTRYDISAIDLAVLEDCGIPTAAPP